jgi:8-oxo-dGTP pyrophosphatase MutT (NUDIX family)
VIVKDSNDLVLLFKGADPRVPEVTYWFTPGGGLDDGETFAEAAARELLEEAGLAITELGGVVHEDEVEFSFEGVTYRQRQNYYAVQLAVDGTPVEIDRSAWTEFERRSVSEHRWWGLPAIETTPDTVYPPRLPTLVRSIEQWGSAQPT